MGHEPISQGDISGTPAGNFPETPGFAALFGHHIRHGTSPNLTAGAPPKAWDQPSFCKAVAEAHKRVRQPDEKPIGPPNKRTFANWFNGHHPPHRTTMLAILRVFFGDHPDLEPRNRLWNAWEQASSGSSPQPQSKGADPKAPQSKTARKLRTRLVDMTIDTAGQGQGFTPDYFPVVADLSWGPDSPDEPGINAEIWLRTFRLTYEEQNCLPAPKTFYGDGETLDGVERVGRSWIFKAPPGGVLRGAPPKLDSLMHMKRADDAEGPPAVTIKASCPSQDDLDVRLRGKTAELPSDTQAIIRRFLEKAQVGSDGSIDLGWASLRWEEPDP